MQPLEHPAAPSHGHAWHLRRSIAFLVALAVALALLPAGAGGVAHADDNEDGPVLEARGIARVCPEGLITDDGEDADDGASADDGEDADEATGDQPPFSDIGTTHAASITCAAAYGLVSGYPDGTFRPEQPITRAQMATFVAAWLRTATGIALTLPDEPRFADIVDNIHRDAIEAIADAGIVSGRADGSFDPTAELTRGQFTRAVANAISYADVLAVDGPLPPEAPDITFTDTPGTTFGPTIHALAGIGIAVGTGDGAFDPQQPVTRAQLSTFLLRAADYLDEYQRWLPTALGALEFEVELLDVTEPDGATDPGAGAGDDDGAADDGAGDDGAGDGAPTTSQDPSAEASEDGTEDPEEPVEQRPAVAGTMMLTVDAFGAIMAYELVLDAPLGPYAPASGLTLHLGDPEDDPPPVLVLATAEELDQASAGSLSGEVFEVSSSIRFVELLASVEDGYVQLATAAHPDGVARGGLAFTGG